MAYNPRIGFIGRSLPSLVRRQSIADLLAARRAAYAQANPEWIDDASDPAAEPINAVADLEFRVMQRFNTGVIQLSAATADAGNLDVLAANIGLSRADQEADDALRARIAAHMLSANIATMPALLSACLTRPGIADAYAAQPSNGQDFEVYVRADEESRKELESWLNEDIRALAGWSYTATIAVATRFYAGITVRYNSTITPLGDLRPAVEAGVRAYVDGLKINDAVHINRLEAACINAGAINAAVTVGTAPAPSGAVDLAASATGYYHVDDFDADIVFTFTDVI